MANIQIIIGSMFSGKSTELIRRCSTYEAIGKSVTIINHAYDTRCDDEVLTHSNTKHKAIKTKSLNDLDFCPMPDVLGIDEAQFFGDLYEFVRSIEDMNIVVIIAGLDGDFLRRPFGRILECIPLCDSITKLNAMCSICRDGTLGSFTKKRDDANDKVVDIGAGDKFQAVCRKHYTN